MKASNIRNIIRFIMAGVFVLLLVLTGCKKKEEPEEVIEPVQEPAEEPVQEETQEVEEETVPETEEAQDPVFYERAKIVYLGCIDENRDLDTVLNRAVSRMHLNVINSIKEDHIIYGKHGNENNVYLIVPEKDITLTIASFPDMSKTYFREKNSGPVIFIEKRDAMNIESLFTAVRNDDRSEPVQFYLGMDPVNNVLLVNDAISQGVDDQSDYDIFDENELKDYASMYEYYLFNEAPGASEDLQDDNYKIGGSGYMVLDNKLYVTYLIQETLNPDKSYQYAMRYDDLSKSMEYLICLDGSGENWIEMGGE